MVPSIRVVDMNQRATQPDGDYVLYWMTAFRRPTWNFSLERAVEWGEELGKPVVVFEALRTGYPWASDRLHTFILEGMADHERWFADQPVTYYPYVERSPGDGAGLLEELARRAAVIVTDDFPCFFLPRMIEAAARKVSVRMEKVDSNGLLPMRSADRVFIRAFDFRRFLQSNLAPHLLQTPAPDPLFQRRLPKRVNLPPSVTARWPAATGQELLDPASLVAQLPIDHAVTPGLQRGGFASALERARDFLRKQVSRYGEDRNEPALDATSGLSAYLHFGQISVHQILSELAEIEEWSADQLQPARSGKREGWWKMSPSSESFLDELVTWRELGFNMCWQRSDHDQFSSLPDWAQETLRKHSKDKRAYLYRLDELEAGQTHDPLWNAAQHQIRREGRMHNYLRMLWGKKILEWSPTPEEALQTMIELNNKYGLDGRNPNSYSGIFWVLGRYDRPWGPERPIFGTIRYMSSDNTARKFDTKTYVARYGS